jgi:hypothetical protein
VRRLQLDKCLLRHIRVFNTSFSLPTPDTHGATTTSLVAGSLMSGSLVSGSRVAGSPVSGSLCLVPWCLVP